jgi:hypothetical protein
MKYMKKGPLAFILVFVVQLSFAQTHTSVPLGDPVYYVLEQAQMRGLCGNLPEAKPYSRRAVLNYIEEILTHARSLSETERLILENFRREFSPREPGLNLKQLSYYFEYSEGDFLFTSNLGFSLDLLFSGGFYPAGGKGIEDNEFIWSTDNWAAFTAEGDIGNYISYGFSIFGGVLRIPRQKLGEYNTYYEGFNEIHNKPDSQYTNDLIPTYSEPLSFFPYSYKKNWDSYVFPYNDISSSGMEQWPQGLSVGWGMVGEISGAIFGDRLSYRFGRIDREWGTSNGNSLILNQAARPFLAFEATFKPVDWFTFSTLTGILEYSFRERLGDSAGTNQNAFSIYMVELNYKNYFHLDFGTSALWPKRFELGYIFPLFDNLLYQSNIGDFDNIGLFFNIKGQYPGIGKIWFSFFLDEISVNYLDKMFELDRQMFAFQFGTSVAIPWLSFTSVKLSYTKNEPYNYTHTREFVPWYGDIYMKANYINNGASLGHYLPPNADEILFRFETMPAVRSRIHLQYQMIRHGADYGSSAVDGSSIWSELDPDGRSTDPLLKKFFLHDGAYQWMHIAKLGGEYTFSIAGVPVTLFAEAGVVFSYFTNIEGPANITGTSHDYSIINTPEYPHSTAIIATLGFRLFSK